LEPLGSIPLLLGSDLQEYIGSLSDNVTSELARTAHVEHYAESIADKSRRRRTLASANALAAATEDPSVSTDECLQQIQESLLELAAASGRTTARHVREFMPEVLRELETQASESRPGRDVNRHSIA
jgi:replicative DNA helicase